MFCRGCRYKLVGLDTCRCPECSRWFDPLDRTTFYQYRYMSQVMEVLDRLPAMVWFICLGAFLFLVFGFGVPLALIVLGAWVSGSAGD
jgi:hypothetical protein